MYDWVTLLYSSRQWHGAVNPLKKKKKKRKKELGKLERSAEVTQADHHLADERTWIVRGDSHKATNY